MKLTQKIAEINGKLIAFVEARVTIDNVSFKVKVDEKQKSFFNYICRNYGFVIGEIKVGEKVEEKELVI